MTLPLSKRQQARNEKVLQELVHSVPGNNVCADCGARNPAWASWSLGIFLCMRCATIHRKLGTHISKVKSLSMDSWSNEQVENMKKVGNTASNKSYNPQNKRPPVPIDADEADSTMERFIRQKYVTQGLSASRRHNTGSTESDETPPPLPPKTPSRFGFRSASSIFPLSSRAKKDAAAARGSSRDGPERSSISPPRSNKASKVFGASVGYDSQGEDDTEKKLAKLRDMGFADDQRNAIVMKGYGGNLERTVEALIRLGEGRSPLPTPRDEFPPPTSRSLTMPAAPTSSASGLSITRPSRPLSPNNPFDMSPVQPVSSQSTGNIQNRNPYHSTNPFDVPPPQTTDAFSQAFQNMSLVPPQPQPQPLFPHHTGGLPNQPSQQQVIYQQAMTPPVPAIPQAYAQNPFNGNQGYQQPVQPLQPVRTGYNPFFASNPPAQQPQPQMQPQLQQQQQQQQQLAVNTAMLGGFANNPFARSPTRITSPTLTQIPEQQAQQNFYTPSAVQPQQPQQQQVVNNPFFNQPMSAPPVQAPYSASQFQPQTQPAQYAQPAVQQPQRPDKASIMALYNYPQLAPQPWQNQGQEQQQQAQQAQQQVQQQQVQQPQQQQYGAASLNQMVQPPNAATATANAAPAAVAPSAAVSAAQHAGSKNPFLSSVASPQPAAIEAAVGSRSRDSMMALGMEWSNGRHSPDAFASLSARDMR
ncbi:UBA domain-containing protein 3 [Pleurostoma richardsiae]|uniref:UBA domain-containing protein 3 n=1 Tax=Pleurostoma richardsiae TaxID=41990 RepID=A0AA38RKU2_9PEZI|nr:UBA domain-containing protein 3 [Pleurostoma richardsiae]